MNTFIRLLLGNLVLKKGPQDLPASTVLMKLSLLAYLISGLPGLLISVDFEQAVLAQALDVLVLLLFIYLCLQLFVKLERYTQTIIALAGVGTIFQLAVLPILFEFKGVVEASQVMLGISLLLLALVSWNLTVIAHIFRESFSVRLPAAIALTICYMFITLSVRKLFFLNWPNQNRSIDLHIHILGICGTFMGGVAVLARQAGHKVTGSDANVYPPMSTQLEEQGIELMQGYEASHLGKQDQVVVGNVMSRGNPAIEHVLNKNMPYNSGPQWLAENVLKDKWVLAVAGTHGKTTTSSILAWILEYAGLQPGFLIGGVPANFGISARLGEGSFFVVEADEYDTAFFDKRSKFIHYHPRTLILNNLEFDHADIFEDLDAIKKQFHHLVRTVPGEGLIIQNADEANLDDVIEKGCWSNQSRFSADAGKESDSLWAIDNVSSDGRQFDVLYQGKKQGTVKGHLLGPHNRMNALSAIIAAQHVGVPVEQSIEALKHFKGVKRRMEISGEVNDITVYDDFAHHPTAIIDTLKGLRDAIGDTPRIWAVLEPRSNTMRMGVHKQQLAASLQQADKTLMFQPADVDWDMQSVVSEIGESAELHRSVDNIVDLLAGQARPGDHILVMSNGAFGGIHQKILDALV